MSNRTPKTKTIAAGWAKGHPFPLTTDVDDRYAEFDRWYAAEIRRAKAEAWRELAVRLAYFEGLDLNEYPNPYRKEDDDDHS